MCKELPYILSVGDKLPTKSNQLTYRKHIMTDMQLLISATKKRLAAAHRDFARYPSATNWRDLETAMYDHQAAHQAAWAEKSYANVIAHMSA